MQNNNIDPKTLGENLLAFRRNHKDLTLSQVFDLAKEAEGVTLGHKGNSDRPWGHDGILPSNDNGREATLPDISTNGRG